MYYGMFLASNKLIISAFITYGIFFILASRQSHADSDCFACAILSHGDEGVVYGTDAKVKIDDLVEPLKGANCKTLAGKPKLFFIQVIHGDTVISLASLVKTARSSAA